jgi:predicted RNase H-like HicB family nuclease
MVIRWSEEDQAYVADLPEFGHCKTHGSPYEEAAKNGREVLELLVSTSVADGDPLPEPALYRSSTKPEEHRRFLEI